MIINIPLAIGNRIYQLQAEREYYFFGIKTPVKEIANKVVYRVRIPDSLKITNGITERIISQHGSFLNQQAGERAWDIKYIVSGE